LCASYYFYMCWKAEYVLLLIFSTLIDYVMGLLMAKEPTKAGRKKYLLISLVVNLGLLFLFKYFNFFSDSARAALAQFNIFYNAPAFKALLPVGISFYTFQTLSYSIDVYRGDMKPERHLGIFALYVSFFPQLVAGPIERPQNLLPQFYGKYDFSYERVRDGLKLMLWGFFKKVVVADRLLFYVEAVYGNVSQHNGVTLLLATVFFAFQIYCDFSGYSDIAIGSAKVMGFDLMRNFNRPYFSKSVAEFWKRWHISLSTWFRDYVYIPLGGSRVPAARWHINLFLTFLISGLWHGANWTYVAWGALHGFYFTCSVLTQPLRERVAAASGLARHPRFHAFIRTVFTFFLVCLGWVFFRAANLSDAILILKKIFFDPGPLFLGGFRDIMYGVMGIVFLVGFDFWSRGQDVDQFLSRQKLVVRWGFYVLMALSILTVGVFDHASQFIYFQF